MVYIYICIRISRELTHRFTKCYNTMVYHSCIAPRLVIHSPSIYIYIYIYIYMYVFNVSILSVYTVATFISIWTLDK